MSVTFSFSGCRTTVLRVCTVSAFLMAIAMAFSMDGTVDLNDDNGWSLLGSKFCVGYTSNNELDSGFLKIDLHVDDNDTTIHFDANTEFTLILYNQENAAKLNDTLLLNSNPATHTHTDHNGNTIGSLSSSWPSSSFSSASASASSSVTCQQKVAANHVFAETFKFNPQTLSYYFGEYVHQYKKQEFWRAYIANCDSTIYPIIEYTFSFESSSYAREDGYCHSNVDRNGGNHSSSTVETEVITIGVICALGILCMAGLVITWNVWWKRKLQTYYALQMDEQHQGHEHQNQNQNQNGNPNQNRIGINASKPQGNRGGQNKGNYNDRQQSLLDSIMMDEQLLESRMMTGDDNGGGGAGAGADGVAEHAEVDPTQHALNVLIEDDPGNGDRFSTNNNNDNVNNEDILADNNAIDVNDEEPMPYSSPPTRIDRL